MSDNNALACLDDALDKIAELRERLEESESRFNLHEAMTGCLTGDCPHDKAQGCADALGARLVAATAQNEAQAAEIERLLSLSALESEYVSLLEQACGKATGFLFVHGMHAPDEDVQAGISVSETRGDAVKLRGLYA